MLRTISLAICLLLLPILSQATQFFMVIIGDGNRPYTPGPALSPGAPENGVPVLNFTFAATMTGRTPTKGPFVVHREVDASSPLLLTTMVNGQALPEVKIVAVISNKPETGTVGFFYSLQKAKIVALDTYAQQPAPGAAAATGTLIERIQFSYDGIAAYFFDGKSSKLAQWGIDGSKGAKSSTGKAGSNANLPLLDLIQNAFS